MSNAKCYCPDPKNIGSWIDCGGDEKPCVSPQAGDFNADTNIILCCNLGDVCGSNSICKYATNKTPPLGSGYYIGGCTDPTGKDPLCRNDCASRNPTLPHEDIVYNSTLGAWSCCGSTADGSVDCQKPVYDYSFKAFPADQFPGVIGAALTPAETVSPTVSTAAPSRSAASSSATSSASSSEISSSSSSATSGSSTTSSDSSTTSTTSTTSTNSSTILATPAPTSATTSQDTADSSSSLTTAEKAGIGVGVGVGVLLIVALILIVAALRKKRSRRDEPQPIEEKNLVDETEYRYRNRASRFEEHIAGQDQQPSYDEDAILKY